MSVQLGDDVRSGEIVTDRGTFAGLSCTPATRSLPRGNVLLIPGFTGSKDDFAELLPLLASAGWAAAAYDQRGQFESVGGPDDDYSLSGFAADAVQVSAAVFGRDERVHLVGHSFGGLVAATAAVEHEHAWASLTLMCSGPGGLQGDQARDLLRAAEMATGQGLEALYRASAARDTQLGVEPPPAEIEEFLHRRYIANSPDGLAAIASLLDSAKTDLGNASVDFPLAGFENFMDAAGLTKFNRALAARVAVYQEKWGDALNALSGSFFDLNGALSLGVYHVFGSGSGDQLNDFFIPQNQTGDVRIAHPSYAADIVAGDDRIGKATPRTAVASLNGLSGDRDVWVYTSSTAPVPIIRNEELILIYTECKIQVSAFPDAIVALNRIRTAHNLPAYASAITKEALLTEMLNQRRFSLYCEGHRWIDLRRYGRLNELPIDRPGDDVWTKFPVPVTEQP